MPRRRRRRRPVIRGRRPHRTLAGDPERRRRRGPVAARARGLRLAARVAEVRRGRAGRLAHRHGRRSSARSSSPTLLWGQWWALWAAIAIGVVSLVGIAFEPRRVRSIGYRLRDDDLLFRRGIMFQRLVAVPYGRMQLVDITRGPVARALGLAELKFVTAAAATAVTVPGLPRRRPTGCATSSSRSPRPAGRGCDRTRAPRTRIDEPRRRRVAPAAPATPAAARRPGLHRGARLHHREPPRAPRRHVPRGLRARPRRRHRRALRDLAERLGERPDRRHRVERARRLGARGRRAAHRPASSSGFWLSWRMHTFRITERGGRGAQRHPVPHAPQRPARPHPGHQRRTGRSSPGCSARRSSRSSVAGQSANVQLAVPRVGPRRRAARRHPAPRLGRARREGGPGCGCRGRRTAVVAAPGQPGDPHAAALPSPP